MNLLYILLVLLPGLVLSGGASMLVQSRFAKYSRVPSMRGLTGKQAAERLLDYAGIRDVKVVRVDGMLTDHYNPTTRQLALSSVVHDQTSIAAIGVAAHEAGHAIQHAVGYQPLKLRSALVPVANLGTNLGTYAMLGGLMVMMSGALIGKWIFFAGVIAFCMFLLFQLVTLPVEFDATNRAKALVLEAGIVTPQERSGMDKVLGAAALTYVAAFVAALLNLVYFLIQAGVLMSGNNRD